MLCCCCWCLLSLSHTPSIDVSLSSPLPAHAHYHSNNRCLRCRRRQASAALMQQLADHGRLLHALRAEAGDLAAQLSAAHESLAAKVRLQHPCAPGWRCKAWSRSPADARAPRLHATLAVRTQDALIGQLQAAAVGGPDSLSASITPSGSGGASPFSAGGPGGGSPRRHGLSRQSSSRGVTAAQQGVSKVRACT